VTHLWSWLARTNSNVPYPILPGVTLIVGVGIGALVALPLTVTLVENCEREKTGAKNLAARTFSFERMSARWGATTFQVLENGQPHKKQLFIFYVAWF